MNMTKNERMKNLAKLIEQFAKEHSTESKKRKSNFLQGYTQGQADTYELCAKWINEILEEYPT